MPTETMSKLTSIHSAAPSAAGYLYQARLALVECLRYAYRDSGIEVAIEKLVHRSIQSVQL